MHQQNSLFNLFYLLKKLKIEKIINLKIQSLKSSLWTVVELLVNLKIKYMGILETKY